MLGVSGKFPPEYIGGVFSGQAVGGIFASVTAVVMIILGTKPSDQAFFCFLVAVLFLAGSLVFYVIITKSAFYQYYLAEKVETKDAEQDKEFKNLEIPETEETEFLDKEKPDINSDHGDGPHPPPAKVVIPHKGMYIVGLTDYTHSLTTFLMHISHSKTQLPLLPTCHFISVNPLKIFGKISIYAISVFLIFMVTLTCFPALTVLTKSANCREYPTWSTKYFLAVSYSSLGKYYLLHQNKKD